MNKRLYNFEIGKDLTKTVGLRISDKCYQNLLKIAEQFNSTKCGIASEMVEMAVKEFLDRANGK